MIETKEKNKDYINLGKIAEALSDKEFPFQIRIECEGREKFSLDYFKDFQGKMKNRTETDIIKILRSIRDYGFSFPFFYWKNSKNISYVMDGHGRLLALQLFKRMGGKLPLFPACHVFAKDKKEAKQKLLRLNSRFGTFDPEGMKEFVSGLEINIDDLDLPEFNMEEIIRSDETIGDDKIPEDIKSITRVGDLWELNEHRVLCGDSTDAEQVEKLMAGEKANMVFTDPPYGVKYDGTHLSSE
ncbi:unnamed protein product, partial [marine sediment metagenome]